MLIQRNEWMNGEEKMSFQTDDMQINTAFVSLSRLQSIPSFARSFLVIQVAPLRIAIHVSCFLFLISSWQHHVQQPSRGGQRVDHCTHRRATQVTSDVQVGYQSPAGHRWSTVLDQLTQLHGPLLNCRLAHFSCFFLRPQLPSVDQSFIRKIETFWSLA